MRRLWSFLALERITVQIALVVLVGGLASSGAVGLVPILLWPERNAPPEIRQVVIEFATIVRILDSIPASERPSLTNLYRRRDMRVEMNRTAETVPLQAQDGLLSSMTAILARDLPEGVSVMPARPDAPYGMAFSVRLRDGQTLLLQGVLGPPDILFSPLGLSFIVIGILAVALSIWVALRIVTPMARFASAVEQFGLNGEGDPLPPQGAAEVRSATTAFNRMRERITRLLEDRTRTMVTISHDLRTPLTRLRLRAEELPDTDLKHGMLRDMSMMEASISSAVSYLREGDGIEASELIDLPSLIETICDQFADAGFNVSCEVPHRLAIHARPQSISRAVTNIIENGTKYASTVVVRLTGNPDGTATIEIEDDGPGIPNSEKTAVLQPFYRASAARRSAQGFGLGLAISSEVARLHGGSLTLHDRNPKGLIVRMSVPQRWA
jgi:signal transduction histidine kinase